MMARFGRNVLRLRSPILRPPILRPQQVLVLLVLLAGMAVRTDANVACYNYVNPVSGGYNYYLFAYAQGKCLVPEMNAAFAGKLTFCVDEGYVLAGSNADCSTTAANINRHTGYSGPAVYCRDPDGRALKWDQLWECKEGAASIQGILTAIELCNNVACSNHGTCQANQKLDGHVCTCNTPDLGGGWDGKECELCNGVKPTTDPAGDCDGITLADCSKNPTLLQACPTTCGMCVATTTTTTTATSTTTTTGLCKGEPDPPDCGTGARYNSSDCTRKNIVGREAKMECPVMCGTCAAPSPTPTKTTTTATTTTKKSAPPSPSPPSPSPSPPSPPSPSPSPPLPPSPSPSPPSPPSPSPSPPSPPSPSPSPPSPPSPSPSPLPPSPTPPTPPSPLTTATTHNEPDDDPAELGTTVLALIGEPIILAITSTVHYHHHAKKKMPRNRQGIFRLLKLWFAIMSCQLLLWVVLMKALYSDGEQVANWGSDEAANRVHLSLAILSVPLHTCVLIWGACCTNPNHNDHDSDEDRLIAMMSAHNDSDGSDDSDDVPLIGEDGGFENITLSPALEVVRLFEEQLASADKLDDLQTAGELIQGAKEEGRIADGDLAVLRTLYSERAAAIRRGNE